MAEDVFVPSNEFIEAGKQLTEEVENSVAQQPENPETEEEFNTKGYWMGADAGIEATLQQMNEDDTLSATEVADALLQTPFNRPEGNELENIFYDAYEEGFHAALAELKNLEAQYPPTENNDGLNITI